MTYFYIFQYVTVLYEVHEFVYSCVRVYLCCCCRCLYPVLEEQLLYRGQLVGLYMKMDPYRRGSSARSRMAGASGVVAAASRASRWAAARLPTAKCTRRAARAR